ncbi:MAG TPA: TfoX/Sxy family protein [Dehalococcoidia bacterium]|nr:TfoX/Sxy family protein [Dehalococcoidia bacterium]
MPYDEALAARIRTAIGDRPDVAEIKMFGGLCFTAGGNMFAGVVKDEYMARLPKDAHEAALARPGARPMDFTGRPMVGFIFVSAEGVASDEALNSWVDQCYDYAASLPAKKPGTKSMARKKKSA